jgi:hypothetical protein
MQPLQNTGITITGVGNTPASESSNPYYLPNYQNVATGDLFCESAPSKKEKKQPWYKTIFGIGAISFLGVLASGFALHQFKPELFKNFFKHSDSSSTPIQSRPKKNAVNEKQPEGQPLKKKDSNPEAVEAATSPHEPNSEKQTSNPKEINLESVQVFHPKEQLVSSDVIEEASPYKPEVQQPASSFNEVELENLQGFHPWESEVNPTQINRGYQPIPYRGYVPFKPPVAAVIPQLIINPQYPPFKPIAADIESRSAYNTRYQPSNPLVVGVKQQSTSKPIYQPTDPAVFDVKDPPLEPEFLEENLSDFDVKQESVVIPNHQPIVNDFKNTSELELDKPALVKSSEGLNLRNGMQLLEHGYFRQGVFRVASSSEDLHPWKFHIYATEADQVQTIADTVLPYLQENKLDHKFIDLNKGYGTRPDKTGLEKLNEDQEQRGKAFTVYAHNANDLAKVAHSVDELLHARLGSAKTSIHGDNPLPGGQSGLIHYRYALDENGSYRANDGIAIPVGQNDEFFKAIQEIKKKKSP